MFQGTSISLYLSLIDQPFPIYSVVYLTLADLFYVIGWQIMQQDFTPQL